MSDHDDEQLSGGFPEDLDARRPDLGVADVSIDRSGGDTVIRVVGEIDLYTRDLLRDVLDECVASRAERIVVDLGAAQFIDTGGLSLMERYARKLDDSGRVLVVRGAGDFTLKLMEILSLDGSLRVEPDDTMSET